jgi:hypothetical protein
VEIFIIWLLPVVVPVVLQITQGQWVVAELGA